MRRFLTLGMYELSDLDAAREFARITYPETKELQTIVDESDTKELSPHAKVDGRILAALNYVNPYLRSYRNKYTFVNFCASKFRGLIQSRMYAGSWLQAMPLQYFGFGYAKFSIAQMMRIFISPNIFNGSSIACYVLIKSLSSANRSKRFSQKFPHAMKINCRKLRSDALLINSA